ncbi:hypothetical protein BDA96_09G081300 [Sorghum bicolor]|jgi:hypothetical protein|uniref:Uncharacterized protein n=2 Tax=Sorghum bicolor TaxID=4558 RepID=A0A921U489_SORBI|nr:hypothetical protein BDA96_09G081300 [Sorghum bicolor]KXG21530.1 hypothetical protein SORBI_3009G077000 [Sorghum bicolor]
MVGGQANIFGSSDRVWAKLASRNYLLLRQNQIGMAWLNIELVASIAVYNQVPRIAIFPLDSATTSFVVDEDLLSPFYISN